MNDVTVCIPTYNQRPAYLAEAVNSVLSQTMPTRLVVVDDGSTVPVPAEGLPPGVKVIRQENQGIAAALNTGIRHTETEWWCWLSSDDLIDPRKVEVQLDSTLEAGRLASFHPYRVTTPAGAFIGMSNVPRPWPNLRDQMTRLANCCWINGSTVMLHRSVFEDVGSFDSEYRYGQDWEFWCRVGTKYLWHLVPETLGTRREGENETERISQRLDLRRIRDAEDARIRERYRPQNHSQD